MHWSHTIDRQLFEIGETYRLPRPNIEAIFWFLFEVLRFRPLTESRQHRWASCPEAECVRSKLPVIIIIRFRLYRVRGVFTKTAGRDKQLLRAAA